MSQPATGTTWNRGGYADIDPRLIARGGLQCVLVRDNRGQATNISPFSTFSGDFASATVGFSPFAQDGELRDDLIAAQLDNGQWVSNPSSNEGFLAIGSQTEDGGAERNPTTSSDDLRILQSNWPVDTAITEKGLSVNFKAVETYKPLIHHLEEEQPLCDPNGDIILPDLGTENYGHGADLDTSQVDRQLLLVYGKVVAGLWLYHVEGIPLCKLDTQAAKQRTKTSPDVADLTFKGLPDPYFMKPSFKESALVPGFNWTWVGGPAWAAFGPSGS